MADFTLAHYFTAKYEGGISDHPADRGGYTAFGVSTAFMKDFAKNPKNADLLERLNLTGVVDRRLMKKIDRRAAAAILGRAFWEPFNCGELGQETATVLYDAAVNCGKSAAVKFMQRGAGAIGQALVDDGIYGPKSRAVCLAGGIDLALAAISERERYFNAIVASRPSQKVFLRGWLNRAAALREYIRTMKA